MSNKLKKPVSVNQTITLEIKELVHSGESIGKFEGFAVFVPQGIPGDIAEVKIISVKPGYARALISKIIKPSELRVTPLCPVTSKCGGCQWQEIDYEKQLQTKEELLKDNLEKIGNIPADILGKTGKKIIGMENPYYYRNKAQFPFSRVNNEINGGFYYTRSHDIVAIDKCYIQHETINTVFIKVKGLLKKYNISMYDEKSHTGLFRHLLVRYAFNTDQLLVTFITTSDNFPYLNEISQELKELIPEITGVVRNINNNKTNVILGEKNHIIYGKDYIVEELENLKFKISVHSFFQVNSVQAVKLYNAVLDYAALKGNETIIDAYAGTGTIALWLARYAKKVIGIEVVKPAVEDGMKNAVLNKLENFSFKTGRVEDLLPDVIKESNADLVILDPPRKGCEAGIFEALGSSEIKKIIYVSCNPATLARDSKLLYEKRFKLKGFQPVDMFPHTFHLETVALFERE